MLRDALVEYVASSESAPGTAAPGAETGELALTFAS
jgi:hypothetical protein